MKEKILAALIKRFEALKIKEEILNRFAEKLAVTTTDEAAIPEVVEGVTFDRIVQSELDSKITDANRKAVENAREKIIAEYEASRKNGGNPKPPAGDNGAPDWFKEYQAEQQKTIEDLKNELSGYKKEKTTEQLTKQVIEALGNKVPKSFYEGRIQIDDPEKVSEVAERLKNDFAALKQEMVNQNLVYDKPSGGANDGDVADGDFDSYLNEKFGAEQAAEN